jgi:hypothetical protein
MAGSRITPCRLQLLACLLGVVAGLVPGLSFTAPFQGLYLTQMTVVGEEWYFGQSLLGLGAGLTLAVLAALEMRRCLASRSSRSTPPGGSS